MADLMHYWTVAQTESQREAIAADQLTRRGFEVYAPKIKNRKRVEPLFPGYIFVRIAERWHAINSTIGVLRVLTTDDHPARLDDRIIAEIRLRESPSGFVRLPRPKPGKTRARILKGSFMDYVGLYTGQMGNREQVEIALFGRMVLVTLQPSDLQFVGP
jgi:transcriptional antiterminator RfaH